MSQTHGSPDTPGRDATPEEEAHVRALLASLRDDDIPMPDDVWSRLEAVIAQERRSEGPRHLAGTPSALGDETGSGSRTSQAPVTDLTARRRRHVPLGWMVGAAAAAVVVLLGGGIVKGALGGGSSSSSAGSASTAAVPEAGVAGVGGVAGAYAAVTSESQSGTAYSATTLGTQVNGLLTRTVTANDASKATTSAPAPATAGTTGLLAGDGLAACLTQLTGSPGAQALLVDRGTWAGAPVDVLVLPTTGDDHSLDVWVVRPTCTATTAVVVQFSRLPRP